MRQLIALSTLFFLSLANTASADEIDFARQIAPIFAEHCVSCHSIRGKSVAEINPLLPKPPVNDINFSTYEKFISYNDEVIDYVYKRGIMPLSLLNFNAFWAEPEGAPALLASFLVGFDLYDENALPKAPGKPFAKPGEDRSAWSPVQLNASASLFASTYQWSVVSSPGLTTASFSDDKIPNPIFTADSNGDYILKLTVGNELETHSQETTLTINDTLSVLPKHQSELTFVGDIMNDIMGATAENSCAGCHQSHAKHAINNFYLPLGRFDGIPVFYTYLDDNGEVNLNLYRHVRARINLSDPENSLLLRKPTGNHHGGEDPIDRATLTGERNYQILLNWIREGAICGDDLICQ